MTAAKAFVMGHPIAHSRSPLMHGHWLKQQGLTGSYEPLDIRPEELANFFAGIKEAVWRGGNVTVPHKLAVMPFLDDIDDDAKAMGAVNTIWWRDGKLIGSNTDAYGLIGNIDELAPGWDKGADHATILGAGGAARAATYGLVKRGLNVAVCNRTTSKALELADKFGPTVRGYGLNEIGQILANTDLLINTTSLGMHGQPPLEIDITALQTDAVVYDVVYVPLETDLLARAKANGHRTVDGLGMLLHQGIAGFEHWFGKKPQITEELRTLLIKDITAKIA